MKCSLAFYGLCIGLILANTIEAARMQLRGELNSPNKLHRRSSSSLRGQSTLTDRTDVAYFINITLGGEEFEVLLDTGSSDLWVPADSAIPNSTVTGQSASVSYGAGSVHGPIKIAPLEFAGYTVKQAFIEATQDDQTPSDQGFMGIGLARSSAVLNVLASATGFTALDNLFLQNLTQPNIITLRLGRTSDPSNAFPGELTVSEVIPDLGDVVNQPKLDILAFDHMQGHIQVLLDPAAAIGPDGTFITVTSTVNSTSNSQQGMFLLDSGTSIPRVPQKLSDGFYANIAGAELQNVTGLGLIWTMPCDQEVNITFNLGGQPYPIHPLDASMDPSEFSIGNVTDSTGRHNVCVGAFQPGNVTSFGADGILGMAFLRSVYMLVDYGNLTFASTHGTAQAYAQLLSTANITAAHQEFVQLRMGGNDTSAAQLKTLLNKTQNTKTTPPSDHYTTPSRHAKSTSSQKIRNVIITVIAVVVVLVLLSGIIVFCFCQRLIGRKRGPSYASVVDPFVTWTPNAPVKAPRKKVPQTKVVELLTPFMTPYNAEEKYDPPGPHEDEQSYMHPENSHSSWDD